MNDDILFLEDFKDIVRDMVSKGYLTGYKSDKEYIIIDNKDYLPVNLIVNSHIKGLPNKEFEANCTLEDVLNALANAEHIVISEYINNRYVYYNYSYDSSLDAFVEEYYYHENDDEFWL